MVEQPRIISLQIGATKVEFAIHRFSDSDDYVDIKVAMEIDGAEQRFESMATLIALNDLRRFGDYVDATLVEEVDYDFVPLNLGFEFCAYDNDDYVSTIRLFLLSAEIDGEGRSYVGCQGPVRNDLLTSFAKELKEFAM